MKLHGASSRFTSMKQDSMTMGDVELARIRTLKMLDEVNSSLHPAYIQYKARRRKEKLEEEQIEGNTASVDTQSDDEMLNLMKSSKKNSTRKSKAAMGNQTSGTDLMATPNHHRSKNDDMLYEDGGAQGGGGGFGS